MLEKLKNRLANDTLAFHKIGFTAGGIFGILVGMIISDRADKFDTALLEEISNGSEENPIRTGESSLEQLNDSE